MLMEKSLGGSKKLNAKDLTAEIERATNLVMSENIQQASRMSDGLGLGATRVESGQVEDMGVQGRNAERLRGIGGMALSNADLANEAMRQPTPEEIAQSNDEIKRIVAAENGYAETGLTPGENVVGGESTEETKEREKSDMDTARIESGVGLPADQEWMNKIAKRTGDELVKEVKNSVDEITDKNNFNPANLERVRFGAMLQALSSNEGHTFGEWN